jgi:putative ABC transport system ATP-binding protein
MQMGFIFQHSHLLKNLSIRDNIVLPGFKSGKMSREQVNQYAYALMKKTGIDGVATHDIKKVSGGQLQRAAICRALIN